MIERSYIPVDRSKRYVNSSSTAAVKDTFVIYMLYIISIIHSLSGTERISGECKVISAQNCETRIEVENIISEEI